MKKVAFVIFHLFLLIFLTIVTCTGGLAHLVWILGSSKLKRSWLKWIVWPIVYFLVWLMTGFIGGFTGRCRLPVNDHIKPASWFYVITNRTFVLDHVNEDVEQMSQWLREEGIVLNYLDSAFPFDVPLIPHWSHQSGACIDFSFVYENGPRGLVYGDFEKPRANETDRPSLCATKNPLYSATKYLNPHNSINAVDVIKTQ
ncbi:MAG: hypothetical protein ACPGWM_06265, partial [Flavobacteriales bacterium]